LALVENGVDRLRCRISGTTALRARLDRAKALIDEMGCHRVGIRDGQVDWNGRGVRLKTAMSFVSGKRIERAVFHDDLC